MRLLFLIYFVLFQRLLVTAQAQNENTWTTPKNIEQLNTPNDEYSPTVYTKKSLMFFCSGSKTQFSVQYFGISQLEKSTSITTQELPLKPKPLFLRFTQNDRVYFSTSSIGKRRSQMSLFSTMADSVFLSSASKTVISQTEDFNSHPTVNTEGSILVFASDRAGGFGGTDLWIIQKLADNTWSEPENIGENINTPGNEITPFLVKNDTLYFSSDGMGGKGGFEILVSFRDQGVWQPPIPLSDVNSEGNDSDFILLSDHRAIFCSDRQEGKGGLDLYSTKKNSR